jgi:hypothetical protein
MNHLKKRRQNTPRDLVLVESNLSTKIEPAGTPTGATTQPSMHTFQSAPNHPPLRSNSLGPNIPNTRSTVQPADGRKHGDVHYLLICPNQHAIFFIWYLAIILFILHFIKKYLLGVTNMHMLSKTFWIKRHICFQEFFHVHITLAPTTSFVFIWGRPFLTHVAC